MRQLRVVGLLVALTFVSTGCGDDKDGKGSGQDAGAKDDAGEPGLGNSTVIGKVVDTDGREIGGVEVHVAGKKVKTDNRGIFEVKGLDKGTHQVAVVDKGHSGAQMGVKVGDDDTAQLSLTVMPLKSVMMPRAEAGGTVTGDDGVSVTLPKAALKTKAGKPVEGDVEARYVAVNDPKTLPAAPGGMKADSQGERVDLESFGMVDMRFYQGDELLSLAEEAELVFPLGPNAFAMGEEIDVWSFDEKTGLWKSEGKGTVDKSEGGNGKATLKAKHFSWWNADKPLEDTGCITGKLLTAAGDPVPNMQVNVTGVDYLTNLNTTTDAEGSFCLSVKRGSTNRLSSFGVNAGSYFEWTVENILAPAEATTCELGSCTDVGTVMGGSLFDECKGNVTSDENHVLVLSSGDAALDEVVKGLLESYGNKATIGAAYTVFDGMTDLADYDVIYLQANSNWSAGDMPEAGQRQIINWVNCGGGLVTAEWTVWKSGTGQFKILDAVYPMAPSTPYGSDATSTYVKVGDEPTIHNGLPDTFTFTADSFAGTEIDLTARPGATIFYDSMARLEGVVGWDFNMGRVVSISTCAGPQSLGDPNYGRMIANVVDWLQRDEPNEPTP
jgi:hypothetical protein